MNDNQNRPILISLVDDHILMRDALASVINGFGNCQVSLLARHGKEFIENLQTDRLPDIVLLDLNMPEMDGFETARWLFQNHPSIYVLVLTMYDSELALIRLLQTGVRGFLRKDIHPSELKLAIETTMKAGYFYLNQAAGKIMGMLKSDENNHFNSRTILLTENEMTFLKLASSDLTYKEIAIQMKISPRTVDNYRDALFVKLNVRSRVGLVLYAIKNGVIRFN